MKILVIGNGGREHALVWKLAQSPRVKKIYCAPGNAGIAELAECVPLAISDLVGLRQFAQEHYIDLTVVGPELPLSLGLADDFRKAKLKVFGPAKNAAKIESSKSFAKELMIRERIPTPASRSFDRLDAALKWLESVECPIVVKADGLAQGKGVLICANREEAKEAVVGMLQEHRFGEAGARVVIEEFIEGEELTVMAFADGRTVVPMIPAQDHKRVGEGDTGLNTGGMGAYAPAPLGSPELQNKILREVLYPALHGLTRVGSPFYGVLYAGLMVKDGQPYVLEFNARFGDPETQVVLPLLQTDLVEVLEAVVEHRLEQLEVQWRNQAAVCVVLTSKGYPGSYSTGFPISGLPDNQDDALIVFHAGTARKEKDIVTQGGRVLGVTALDSTIRSAQEKVYGSVGSIQFEGRNFRTDIAQRVL